MSYLSPADMAGYPTKGATFRPWKRSTEDQLGYRSAKASSTLPSLDISRSITYRSRVPLGVQTYIIPETYIGKLEHSISPYLHLDMATKNYPGAYTGRLRRHQRSALTYEYIPYTYSPPVAGTTKKYLSRLSAYGVEGLFKQSQPRQTKRVFSVPAHKANYLFDKRTTSKITTRTLCYSAPFSRHHRSDDLLEYLNYVGYITRSYDTGELQWSSNKSFLS